MNEEKKKKPLNNKYDLDSVVGLLKKYNSPEHIQPMQNVMYSSVQMFAASWLATTQTISQLSSELERQNQIIESLQTRVE